MVFENIERKYIINIFRLLRGAVLIQAIQLVGTFILTFYFKKEDFGVLSFIVSVSTLFEMIVGFQYNNAAIVTDQQKNVLKLMLISVLSAISFSAFLLICISVSKNFIPVIYAKIYLHGFILVLPFFIISNYIFNNGILLLKYFGKIRNINNFRALYVILSLVAKFVAALWFATAESLVYAHLFGIVIIAIMFMLKFRTKIELSIKQLTFNESMALVKKNYRFPKYAVFSGIINAASTISFPILITFFWGLHENGVYYLSSIFIFQPLLLLLQAVSDAFLQKVKVLFYENKTELFKFIKIQQRIIIKILIPYFIIALLAGELLFQHFLPVQWDEIGKFIKFQLLFYLFTSLYSPFSIIADFMKKQQFLLVFNFSHLLFQFFILFFLHNYFDFTFVILIASVASAIHYGFINFYMLQKLKLYK
jgi:O-antigen/teichoic acid export membrane protein